MYKKATGTPATFTGPDSIFYCTYDDRGNLFVDGTVDGSFTIVELVKGATSLSTLPTNARVGLSGGLAWDGSHLAQGDQEADIPNPSLPTDAVYVLSIKDGSGTVIKTVPLTGAMDVVQFWLQKSTIIAPDASNEDVGYFDYPEGGNPTKTIDGFYEPVGATISNPPK